MESTTWAAFPSSFECNPHVVNGYRPIGRPWFHYVASVFSWHNETVNVWTMVLGFFVFLDALERASGRCFSLSVFAACTACMFACSSMYHTLWPKSRSSYAFFIKLDHACIIACIGSYGFPVSDVVFDEDAVVVARLFRATTTLVTAWGVSEVALTTNVNTTRRLRICARTAWFVLVLIARAIFRGRDATTDTARRLLLVGTLYPIGAALYATRFPEKARPGWFDYFGSHEIMHACVLVAAVWHLKIFESAL